jgi:subtilase family serine protease
VRDDLLIDLLVTEVSGPAQGFTSGTMQFTNTVRNLGTENIEASFAVGLYLSSDAVITTNDHLVATRVVPGLAAGQSNTAVTGLTIPLNMAAGLYYLGAIADPAGAVNELDESNNALAGNPIQITIGPDLEAVAVSGPVRVGTAMSFGLTNAIRNVGTGNPGTFRVGLYLSADDSITTNDVLLASRTVVGLAPGETNLEVTTVTVPANLPPASYWFGVIADDLGQVPEMSEANNALAGNMVEIVPGPDLVMTKLLGSVVANTGGIIALTNTVRNIGLVDIDSSVLFRVGFYLSTDSVITTNDMLLGTRFLTGLAAGGSSSILSIVGVPTY